MTRKSTTPVGATVSTIVGASADATAEGVLGIDIGASGIKAALVDVEHGTLLTERLELPTPSPATIEAMSATIAELVEPWRGQYSLAGVAFPATVRRGIALSAVNVAAEWVYADLGRLFTDLLGTPVWALNDCDAAAYAEVHFGAGRHESGTILMATLGTGVGTTLIVERHLVPNVELGLLPVRGKQAGLRVSNSARKRKNLSWRAWAADLQIFIEMVDMSVAPDLVILGGGASEEAHRFLQYLHCRPRVVPARLRNRAGIIGAAAYANQHQRLFDEGGSRKQVIDLTQHREEVSANGDQPAAASSG